MGAAWQQMRSRRLGVSMLYPFSVPYYAQFGYVPAAGYGMVTVPLAAWQGWRSLDSRGWRVRRVPAEGVGAECLAFLRTIAPQNHGWAVPRAGESQWRWWYQQRLCLFLERDGQLDAVALYSLNNGTGTTAGSIKIWLWGWRYEAGRQQLLHFFAQHRDQVSTVTMDVPTQTSVHHGWGTLPHLLPVHMALPWMVRVVDLAHLPAIPLGGASGTPPLAIAISDSLCPWNAGTWLWANQRGNLRCTPAGTSGGQVPPLTATIEAVTALIYGTHTPAELVAQQWLSGDDRSLELLDTWFPPRAFYNPFKF
jgi:predicted acetyltransferase